MMRMKSPFYDEQGRYFTFGEVFSPTAGDIKNGFIFAGGRDKNTPKNESTEAQIKDESRSDQDVSDSSPFPTTLPRDLRMDITALNETLSEDVMSPKKYEVPETLKGKHQNINSVKEGVAHRPMTTMTSSPSSQSPPSMKCPKCVHPMLYQHRKKDDVKLFVPPFCLNCKTYMILDSLDGEKSQQLLNNLTDWMADISSFDGNIEEGGPLQGNILVHLEKVHHDDNQALEDDIANSSTKESRREEDHHSQELSPGDESELQGSSDRPIAQVRDQQYTGINDQCQSPITEELKIDMSSNQSPLKSINTFDEEKELLSNYKKK